MRRKKVWRYYCEFCKKANCSAPSIKKHEQRCTMNPDRYCGFCDILDKRQPTNINEVIALLPVPTDYLVKDEHFESYSDQLSQDIEKIMPRVRDSLENCPACIMSALRRKGIPMLMVKSFNFSERCKEVWADYNESQREQEPWYS